jgi:hypothetical protein
MLLVVCLITATLPATAQQARPTSKSPQAPGAGAPGWPREFQKDGARLIVYQPQLQVWQKYRVIIADTAIAVTPKGGQPTLGVVSWRANTIANLEKRVVVVKDIELMSARFPSLDTASATAIEQQVRHLYPATGMTIGLDRLLAALEASKTAVQAVAVQTQPPPIFVSTVPAIVLFVDGQPLRIPIQGTKLEFVVNTNWDLFYDQSDYYLLNEKTWLKARELAGPWTVTSKLPPDMSKLPANQNWEEVKQAVPPASGAKSAPRVFVTTQPAELLAFQGEPVYARIPGTNLTYATNTDNDVFMHTPDNQIYVLLSGRWFRAAQLAGPWSYASNTLPEDFARIPLQHARARILAAIPGTQAAHDAVLLAQIPTTAIVNRAEAEARVQVTYTGEPQFKPIETTTLVYAVNAQEKVIKYGDLYYLCLQGVWFVSTMPTGPWKTADAVPGEIYTIPATSPVYNVTYVTVSNPTSTTVECSYTTGYLGMFVVGAAAGATVVYGTGYYHAPYYAWGPYPYPIYYPYPYTYGVGAVYNPHTGVYGAGRAVYGPYGAAGRAGWYNPATGTYGRAATVQTAYGGRTVATAHNPWTGTYAATRQGSSPYGQRGSSVAIRGDDWIQTQHVTTSQGTAFKYQTSQGGAGAAVSGPGGQSGFVAKDANNNVYVGNDGNVYKKDTSGNWNKYENGNWNQVDPAATKQQAQSRPQDAGLSRQSPPQPASGAGATREAGQFGQARPGVADQSTGLRSSRPAITPDTLQQLDREALSRQRGALREQMHGRELGGLPGVRGSRHR